MAAKKRKTKKKAKKKAAKKTASKGANALDFCRAYLRKKRKAEFAEIRDAAAKKGLTLYPISFGRAQALEGIVKSRPYGSGKKKATPAKRGPGRPKGSKNRRGPGRPPKSASAGLDSIDNLVGTLKTLQRERDDALKVIEKIRSLLASL